MLATGLVGLGVGAYYIEQCIVALVLFSSIVGSHNVVENSAKNGRGDEVTISTEASGRWQDPDKTVVQLQRADHWFSTTLVETQSFGVRNHLNWRNDDTLEVTLGFGCLTSATREVENVGSIRIYYHFSDGDTELARGCPD